MKNILILSGIVNIGLNASALLVTNYEIDQKNNKANFLSQNTKSSNFDLHYLPVGYGVDQSLGLVPYEKRINLLWATRNFIDFTSQWIPKNAKILGFSDNVLSSNDTSYAYGIFPKLEEIFIDLYNNHDHIVWNYENYYTQSIAKTKNHFMFWTMGYTNNLTNKITTFTIRSQPIPENILVSEGWTMKSLITYLID